MKINPLRGASCYLGGPIQYDTSGVNWRVEPTKVLTERFGISLFDPFSDPKQMWLPELKAAQETKNYDEMVKIATRFVRKDLDKVDRADMLIACLPKGVPTTGTTHEIIYSNNRKKPTLLVCPQGREEVPLWYWGFMNPDHFFGSWDDLYKYLSEVDAGLHAENRRWHYLYDLI